MNSHPGLVVYVLPAPVIHFRNHVMHRFALYILASCALWVIMLRAFIGAVNAG
jgi:hypothetical protein